MATIKISTLNCRGAGNQKKRLKLFEWLRIQNYDIVILTETNCFSLDMGQKWAKEWGGDIFWSFA